MPDQLQLRGGTTTEHNSFTGAAREVTVDTTKKTLVVHDGSQAGGTPLMKESGGNAASTVQIGTGGTNALNIDSSQKIGIGQASPTTTLDVNGDVTITDKIIHSGDTNTLIRFPSNDNIQFDVNGSERLRIDNSDFVTVKHATTAKLRIQNSTAATSQTCMVDMAPAGTASGVQLKCVSDEDFSTGANRTAHFRIDVRENGTFTERFRIDSSGRVGISQTPVSEKLEVSGAIRSTSPSANFSAGAEAVFMDFVSGDRGRIGTITGTGSARDLAFNIGNLEKVRIDTTGRVMIGTTTHSNTNLTVFGDGTNDNKPAVIFQNSLTGTGSTNGFYVGGDHDSKNGYVWNYEDSNIVFATGNTNRMRIDTAGRLLIGTSTNTFTGVGSSRLQVSGTGADTSGINLIRTSNDGGGAYLQFTKNRGSATQSGDNCGAIAWLGHDGTDVESYLAQIRVVAGATATSNSMTGDITFETADGSSVPSERMRLDSAGRLLIGSNNPNVADASIDDLIVGSAANGKNDGITIVSGTSQNGTLAFADSGGATQGLVGYVHNGDYLRLHAGNTLKVRIDTDGLKFNSDTAAANALNDYEEGTFTPSITQGLTSPSYVVQVGHYTKIGNQVFAYIYLLLSASGTTGSSLVVGGLPYTNNNVQYNEGGGYITYLGGTFGTAVDNENMHALPWIAQNVTNVVFHTPADGNNLNGNDTTFASGTNRYLIFHVRYKTA